jgi:hypothetical protein
MIREWIASVLRSIGATSVEFRTEEVRVSQFPLPVWECVVSHGKGKRLYSRTHMVESKSPAVALALLMERVPAGCTIRIDGTRYRWNEGATRAYAIDPAHRSGKGDRARWRGQKG